MRAASLALAIAVAGAAPASAQLDPGLGPVHWKMPAASAEAQKYFDQGMAYLYAFNHEQSVRSFQRAAALDPNFAMAKWGEALALGPNINMDVDPEHEKQAFAAVREALKKLSAGRERELIEALALRYSGDPKADLKKLAADYSRAMGELAKKYPEDDDVAVLYAESMMDLRPWRLWSNDGTAAEGTEEIIGALESVLRRNPNHVGANHYLIHALEASPHPERAAASAQRLAHLAPAAGHLVHMPAHILARTGDYAGAADANVRAAAADRAFIRKYGGGNMYTMMYLSHNLQFGSYANAMQGRYDEAKDLARQLAANLKPMEKEMPPVGDYGAMFTLLVPVRFARWPEVVRARVSGRGPLSTAISHFAVGTAMARMGNVAGAESERRELAAMEKDVPDSHPVLLNSPKDVVAIAARLLAGRVAEAKGDCEAAVREYTKAVMLQDALNYNEPPDWFYPTRETLGGALLRAGRAADAEAVFREDLKKHPKNPRSLFGLAQALRRRKKSAAAAETAFARAWKGAPLRVEDL